MSHAVILDAGPLGLATNPKRSPLDNACNQWVQGLLRQGVRVIVPELADYEVRRELLRASKLAGLMRLEGFLTTIEYLPLTTPAMRQAARFWAEARQQGQQTAHDKNIDGDCILAAQAATLGVADFVIATTNVRHLARFVPAELWQSIS